MNGPANGIMGGDTSITDMPQTQVDDTAFLELQKTARFSKTAEYKELKKYLEDKITYWQSFLPGNVVPEHVPDEERGKYWAVSNIVVKELRAILNVYEGAAEQVKDEIARRKRA